MVVVAEEAMAAAMTLAMVAKEEAAMAAAAMEALVVTNKVARAAMVVVAMARYYSSCLEPELIIITVRPQ